MAQLTPITISGFVAGAQTNNTAWTTGLTVPQNGIYYVTVELASACVVNMAIDNATYYPLNGGVSLNAGWNTLAIPLRANDTVNFNQSSGGSITVNVLRVDF